MRLVGIVVLAVGLAAMASCRTAPPVEQPPGGNGLSKDSSQERDDKSGQEKKAGPEEAKSYAMTRLPELNDRAEFERMLTRLKTGSDQERRTVMVAFQLKMELCLPFIIEHLEDKEPFKGLTYLYVTRLGERVGDFVIPDKGFNAGAALELFLASYFRRDPARKTFNIPEREGATDIWKAWYEQRKSSFRWAKSGVYSTR
jgi:hypothetical protein